MGLIGFLVLGLFQMLMIAGFIVLWKRTRRTREDDFRWNRSFQLLETKIAVFEDLSDRTEAQVKQLTQMMEQKVEDLQRKIEEADTVLHRISNSMEKSMEVAQIFQDKIPHEEMLERQNTLKFVKAALMAHEGYGAKEIAAQVDLPKAQIEFIVKVNADRLSFDASQMPEWLKAELNKDSQIRHCLFEKKNLDSLHQEASLKPVMRPLQQILKDRSFLFENLEMKEDFSEQKTAAISPLSVQNNMINEGSDKRLAMDPKVVKLRDSEESALGRKAKDLGIRPVVFPRIEL